MADRKLWSNGQFAGKIAWLASTMAKVDQHIHGLLVQSMAWAEKHGSTDRMVSVIQALGQTSRRKGALVWVEAYSPIRMKADGTESRLMKPDQKGYTPFNVDTAEARPFWTLEAAEERTAKPLSVEALLGILKGYDGKIDKIEKGEKSNYELKGDKTVLRHAISSAISAIQNVKAKETPTPTPANDKLVTINEVHDHDPEVLLTGTNG